MNSYSCLPSSKLQHDINTRIYDRNIPSSALQPYLDVRPVATKYSRFPIVDPRKRLNIPLTQEPTYNIHNTFNPGDRMAPWSGFASNVNLESELRNQIYALQSCSQAVYVPDSSSDLYTPMFHNNKQQHELVFKKENFDKFNPNTENLGYLKFNNCTRQQLRNVTKNKCS
jgi:hypothetical protein